MPTVPPPPATPREDVVDTYFGERVTDPYRWLEDAASPRVAKWTEAQNAHTRAVLDSVPRVDSMHARTMAALLQAHRGAELALLRVDRDAGHGVGKPLSKQVDDLADQWAFLAWRLGGTVEA